MKMTHWPWTDIWLATASLIAAISLGLLLKDRFLRNKYAMEDGKFITTLDNKRVTNKRLRGQEYDPKAIALSQMITKIADSDNIEKTIRDLLEEALKTASPIEKIALNQLLRKLNQ